jgi:hypothetical protein
MWTSFETLLQAAPTPHGTSNEPSFLNAATEITEEIHDDRGDNRLRSGLQTAPLPG